MQTDQWGILKEIFQVFTWSLPPDIYDIYMCFQKLYSFATNSLRTKENFYYFFTTMCYFFTQIFPSQRSVQKCREMYSKDSKINLSWAEYAEEVLLSRVVLHSGGFLLVCQEGLMNHSLLELFFFKWRSARRHLFYSLGQNQSTVAQQAKMTAGKFTIWSTMEVPKKKMCCDSESNKSGAEHWTISCYMAFCSNPAYYNCPVCMRMCCIAKWNIATHCMSYQNITKSCMSHWSTTKGCMFSWNNQQLHDQTKHKQWPHVQQKSN